REPPVTLAQFVGHLPWAPHLRRPVGWRVPGNIQAEICGNDANDRAVPVVEREVTADDVLPAEAALPQGIGHDYHILLVRFVIIVRESAVQYRVHTYY